MTVTRPPRIVIHLTAISVLLLFMKPILMVGMILGVSLASLASVMVTVENSIAPPIVGAGASLMTAAPFLRSLYRRVVAVESGDAG